MKRELEMTRALPLKTPTSIEQIQCLKTCDEDDGFGKEKLWLVT